MKNILILVIAFFAFTSQAQFKSNKFTTNANPQLVAWTNNVKIESSNFVGNGANLTGLQGSNLSGTITAMVQNYSGLSSDLDTNTLALGVLAYPYDTGNMRVGDGATLGGLQMSYRPWAYTNWSAWNSKAGELAVYRNNSDTNSVISSLFLNASQGTNWMALFSVSGTNVADSYIAFGNATADNVIHVLAQNPIFKINMGRFGANALPEFALGIPSPVIDPIFEIINGNGGDAVVGGFGGPGGQFGDPVFLIKTGDGGAASAVDAVGGTGGGFADGTSPFLITAGKGGDSAFAFIGGNGGYVSGLRSVAGNGENATASANGADGANTGRIDISAGGRFAGGSILVHSPTNRSGGTIESFNDTYVPAVKFTTITTAGPTNTTSETTILGTLAGYGTPSTVIKSNVLDHAGRTIRFRAAGYVNTTLTPTLQLKFKFGSTALLDTGAVTLSAITGAETWVYEGQITFRSTGSSASYIGYSTFSYYTVATVPASFSAPVTTAGTISTVADQTIDLTAQFSSAALNSLQATTCFVEIIN